MQKVEYAAKFVHLNKADTELNECVLTISTGQKVHEGEKFIATLKLINEHFKKCLIFVCDTLQRHSIAIVSNSNQELMYYPAKREGDQWIDRNEPLCKTYLNIPYTIRRWDDWFKTESYLHYRKEVDKLYFEDPKFVHIVDGLAQEFSHGLEKRGDIFDGSVANKHSKEYLLEECAVMCIWHDEGYFLGNYPPIRNNAIEYTFSQIKKEVYGGMADPVDFKFKKVQTFDKFTSSLALEKIIDILPGHVYWKDAEGRFLGCNHQQAISYGVKSASMLVNKYDKDVLRSDIAEKIRENDKKIMKSKKTCTFEEETFINGRKTWVISRKAPIIDENGKVLGVIGVSIDTSDKKQLEKSIVKQASLEEALSHKKSFLNTLSHEIRTPLHVIMSISDELYRNVESLSKEERKSLISVLLQSNKRLLRLATNLLEVAKSEQGKSVYFFDEKNLVVTVSETIKEIESCASISLKTEHSDILVNIDELKISQVLRNLIDNAIKFGDSSSIIVELTKSKVKKNVVVQVKNKSIGIIEKERKKVFESFFQGSNNTQKSGGGLGLSICKEIISAHKGSIWVDQNKLDQTVFSFTLPYIE